MLGAAVLIPVIKQNVMQSNVKESNPSIIPESNGETGVEVFYLTSSPPCRNYSCSTKTNNTLLY